LGEVLLKWQIFVGRYNRLEFFGHQIKQRAVFDASPSHFFDRSYRAEYLVVS